MKPTDIITQILNNACKKALHFINQKTVSPEKRKNISATKSGLPNIQGYCVLKQPKKDAADLTRRIDAETETLVFRLLKQELYDKAGLSFVVMSEERGVLSCPEKDFDPHTVESFLLILLDPVDGTDLVRTGFGGAVAMAAATVEVKGKGKTARVHSAVIHSGVGGDLTKNEVYWAEAGKNTSGRRSSQQLSIT